MPTLEDASRLVIEVRDRLGGQEEIPVYNDETGKQAAIIDVADGAVSEYYDINDPEYGPGVMPGILRK